MPRCVHLGAAMASGITIGHESLPGTITSGRLGISQMLCGWVELQQPDGSAAFSLLHLLRHSCQRQITADASTVYADAFYLPEILSSSIISRGEYMASTDWSHGLCATDLGSPT